MDTSKLKKFAQYARRSLMEQVTAKLKRVLAAESPARRERPEVVAKLEEHLKRQGEAQVVERVAYTWFNRFCALRFMDVNRYNRINIVSPADPGQFQPEILAEAKMGHIDAEMVSDKVRQQVFALLDGKAPSRDPQGEAYPLLVVAACNYWNKAMPFLFQRIDDYTELLMPDDLLSGNSILAYTREAMTPEACGVGVGSGKWEVGSEGGKVGSGKWEVGSKEEEKPATSHSPLSTSHSAASGGVEVIGWLYQFYISEKKDEVFAALKKNKKITPENIPAATQLFTPNWIVRYLVENSLGRLWLLNRPGSKLVEQMKYYIKPEQAETDFLNVGSPEELKICDPACGSGHMLTYAFDLLYAIYEEEGYEPAEIPEKILTHNLYGVEIDERAGELAAFALTMKAREKQRRFFRKPVQPNICVLESVRFEDGELKDYLDFVGRDLFTEPLRETLHQFREADNFGSLIRPAVTDVGDVLALLEEKDVAGQLFLYQTHQKVLKVLKQTDYLSPQYHVVVTNPPYMGVKGMNGRLGAWAKDNYPNSKSDLFAMFIERGLELVPRSGYSGMVTMQSWMFLSSYEHLRARLLTQTAIESMAHMANMVMGIAFGTAATVWKIGGISRIAGAFCYVEYEDIGSENKPTEFPPLNDRNIKAPTQDRLYRVAAEEFRKVAGSPIAYWISSSLRSIFSQGINLEEYSSPRQGLSTTNNDLFLRQWFEVDINKISLASADKDVAGRSGCKWFPYSKGGEGRRWYGNHDYVIDWELNGYRVKDYIKDKNPNVARGETHYFKPAVTWSLTSSSKSGFAARIRPMGFIFDINGMSSFPSKPYVLVGYLNSVVANEMLKAINPTMAFQVGDIKQLRLLDSVESSKSEELSKEAISIAKSDWDWSETSWDFKGLPLLIDIDNDICLLSERWFKTHEIWQRYKSKLLDVQKANNALFIDAYGLQDELMPEVPLNEITLTCNPHYRYGSDKTAAELEALLLADTMKEFISYAVGCMFGRYALDKPGLILANQGETIEEYRKLVPDSTFPADEDNVIPMLDGDWFPDDIAGRFRKFLRVTFGEEHYEENLKFLETAIGKDIRKYFLRDFYTDHLKRYKKRPIYWLFSSPKGSFNALIYMHRYRPDTVSIVLNEYLRELRTKLVAETSHQERISISDSASASDKTKALKEIEDLTKRIQELDDYERDVLYPLATQQIAIDLDDGVKVNYPKFGKALKKIPGLEAKED